MQSTAGRTGGFSFPCDEEDVARAGENVLPRRDSRGWAPFLKLRGRSLRKSRWHFCFFFSFFPPAPPVCLFWQVRCAAVVDDEERVQFQSVVITRKDVPTCLETFRHGGTYTRPGVDHQRPGVHTKVRQGE